MIPIPDAAINLIKSFEGCRLQVYTDPIGLKTIGIGHLIKPGDHFVEINEMVADELLYKDLQISAIGCKRLIRIPLNDNQFSSLLSFTFNLGSAALQRSTLRQKINRQELSGISSQFLKWCYAGGIKLPGLVRRRAAEAELFIS